MGRPCLSCSRPGCKTLGSSRDRGQEHCPRSKKWELLGDGMGGVAGVVDVVGWTDADAGRQTRAVL